jgi:pyruvate/2-oxoglutarate dehydrogenase complex dihydrolipoamide acyltransferase (E2) component
MEALLDQAIKEVITEFPEIGAILGEYGAGCVTCAVGTCLLKDIVSIHGLSAEDEGALMARIAAAPETAAPERAATTPATAVHAAPAAPAAKRSRIKYSPPMLQLVDEHALIEQWVALIPGVIEAMDLRKAEDRVIVQQGIEFIRSYAEELHHAKEEGVLFAYFEGELPAIQAFRAEHDASALRAVAGADRGMGRVPPHNPESRGDTMSHPAEEGLPTRTVVGIEGQILSEEWL